MTTQQDSVDVERLRAALEPSGATKAAYHGEFSFRLFEGVNDDGEDMYRKVYVPWDTVKEIMSAIRARAALSLPITQRDEQASRRAEAALSVAEMLVPFTTHNIGCAVYQRSYAGGSPVCTCGVEAGREAVTAIRRLSIEQGDQDGGEG